MCVLMEHRANIQRRMPTAPDSRQIDVARLASRRSRGINRASSSPGRSREALDGPLQLLRLPQYVFQKMRHGWLRKGKSLGIDSFLFHEFLVSSFVQLLNFWHSEERLPNLVYALVDVCPFKAKVRLDFS